LILIQTRSVIWMAFRMMDDDEEEGDFSEEEEE
jgi:hypothetical protein